jgi:UDP-N-acetylmuramyl tripeptide synthase
MNQFLILSGKILSQIFRALKLGNGSTWPGHIALSLNQNFIKDIFDKSKTKTIFIVGTNGKTTTSKLVSAILEKNGYSVLHNSSGANLLNGIASSLILQSDMSGNLKKDFAILEIDENVFPLISKQIEPDFLISLNLFRDQLDRYGEIDSISKNWKKTIDKFINTKVILNADDPQISFLGKDSKLDVSYFGLNEEQIQTKNVMHGADSILCPNCHERLEFKCCYFSHLGIWECKNCKYKRPNPTMSSFSFYPLPGKYAMYNILAAVLFAKKIGIKDKDIVSSLKNFKPAFGRQEELEYKKKNVQLFLSKNPTSFNESLSTVAELNGKTILIVLNDKIPDGLDVSWIWDINFESIIIRDMNLIVAGDRKFDMALRLKYSGYFVHIAEDLNDAIEKSIENLEENEKLYILPNYSAMLETRKILTGKEIL